MGLRAYFQHLLIVIFPQFFRQSQTFSDQTIRDAKLPVRSRNEDIRKWQQSTIATAGSFVSADSPPPPVQLVPVLREARPKDSLNSMIVESGSLFNLSMNASPQRTASALDEGIDITTPRRAVAGLNFADILGLTSNVSPPPVPRRNVRRHSARPRITSDKALLHIVAEAQEDCMYDHLSMPQSQLKRISEPKSSSFRSPARPSSEIHTRGSPSFSIGRIISPQSGLLSSNDFPTPINPAKTAVLRERARQQSAICYKNVGTSPGMSQLSAELEPNKDLGSEGEKLLAINPESRILQPYTECIAQDISTHKDSIPPQKSSMSTSPESVFSCTPEVSYTVNHSPLPTLKTVLNSEESQFPRFQSLFDRRQSALPPLEIMITSPKSTENIEYSTLPYGEPLVPVEKRLWTPVELTTPYNTISSPSHAEADCKQDYFSLNVPPPTPMREKPSFESVMLSRSTSLTSNSPELNDVHEHPRKQTDKYNVPPTASLTETTIHKLMHPDGRELRDMLLAVQILDKCQQLQSPDS